jgi:phage terminase Nu1 subunit (DNA packaging protein)
MKLPNSRHVWEIRSLEKQTASIREFARIVGVNQASVSRAAKKGERLSASVIRNGGSPRIIIYDGCLEWHQNKDLRKDRKLADQQPEEGDDAEEMTPAESNRVLRHYEALQAKLSFEKEAGNLISIDKFKTEAFTVARATRDSLLYLPNESEREFKRLLTEFIRNNLGEDRIKDFTRELNDLGLAFRVYQKSSITKALRDMVSERFGTESLLKEDDETAT